jgi:hypothetical protein
MIKYYTSVNNIPQGNYYHYIRDKKETKSNKPRVHTIHAIFVVN